VRICGEVGGGDSAGAGRDAAGGGGGEGQDLAEEWAEQGGGRADARVQELRAEVSGLRAALDQMSSGLDELRNVSAGGAGADGVNRVLEAQVLALTQARKAEAAELGRILDDLTAEEGAGHA